MRAVRFAPLLVLALALAGPAVSEEIIHFTNGTTLAVRSHQITDGMIHVDLGDNGFMAFPEFVVERIEEADAAVKLTPSRFDGSTDKVARVSGGARTGSVGGRPEVEVLETTTEPRGRNVTTDENGTTVYRPFQGSRTGKRTVGATGNMKLLNQGGSRYRGTVPLGNRHVIGGTQDPRGRPDRPQAIGIEQGGGGSAPGGHQNKDRRTNPTRDDSSPKPKSDG